MGVIRLQDQMALDKSAIQPGDKDRVLLVKNELHKQHAKARSPD